ncbi:MAG: hypothetical protein KAV00_17540 [Phycisphaerae bacterium]|nr:hypothetical protein [Phycisphaerae bacterium]
MNRLTEKFGAKKVVLGVLVMCVALLCVFTLLNRPPVAKAASPEGRADVQSRKQEHVEIMYAFKGYVDIYLDVQNKQPFLADVQAKEVMHAAGSTFIRFQHRNGESWCVDADRIVAYRIRRK